jgi:hypothetical protein
MTAELRDVRAKIFVETDETITAIAEAEGLDKSEVIRDWLAERARVESHRAYRIVNRLNTSKGSSGSGGA